MNGGLSRVSDLSHETKLADLTFDHGGNMGIISTNNWDLANKDRDIIGI